LSFSVDPLRPTCGVRGGLGMKSCWTIIAVGVSVTIAGASVADSAEIKVVTVRAGATVLEKVQPEFERTTGHKLKVVYDPEFVSVGRRLNAGEPFDVYISSPMAIDGLIKTGKIDPQTRTNLMHCGMGVEVRAGSPKPDINSVEAFKRTLLNAKSVGYIAPNRVQDLIERLGLTEAMRSKTTTPNSDIVSELVAKGELELGIVVITQIFTTLGVDLVGPLPPELQYDFQFGAAISADSYAPDAAKDLLKFLTGPLADTVIRSQGMEPG
jgi:molybdate transport system substrate-binding protein